MHKAKRFSTLPLEIYGHLSKFLDGPELVALVYTHRRLGVFLMKTNKRWQQLYLDQFPPQDPKERDWLQWFTGGQSRCDDRGIPWSEAYCLRWRTAQNLQQGKHASYTIMLDDENNKDANRLEVILATDKRLILDCWHSKSIILVTLCPPKFNDVTFSFQPVKSVHANRFNYSRFNYLEGSDFKLGHYYLMAFENLNSQVLCVYPLSRGRAFQVECALYLENDRDDQCEDDGDVISFGVSISTSNHMSVGMHWCLVIQLDTTKDLYVSRVYHPASRRWCNTMIDAPNRHVGFWCSTIWREDVHSTIVAHLTVKPSIQEDVHEVTLQLWTFSLDTPLAHCTHTCRFSIDDTVVSDDNFKVSISSLNHDWLLITVMNTSSLRSTEIFYRPVLTTNIHDSDNVVDHGMSNENSWRVQQEQLHGTPPFMIGVDRVGVQTNDTHVNIYSMNDGALLWSCPIDSDTYSLLLNGILLDCNMMGDNSVTDIYGQKKSPISSVYGNLVGSGRYITASVTTTNAITIHDFSY